MNIMQLITQLRQSSNPEQLLMGLMEQNMKENPVAMNMINLIKEGKYDEFENIARNIAKEKGIDYDTAYARFRQNLGL